MLRREFVCSTNVNARNGGLIGLAATAIGLSQVLENIADYLTDLVPPVLSCFADNDSRARYYACEALYNISRVARADVLVFFNRIFDGLCRLAADTDPVVKSGAELLDRLIKDVVTEYGTFDVDRFIPLLSERIYAKNPHVRQYLVSWLLVLDSVPDIHLVGYLPDFLNGLFKILSDPAGEIRQMCLAILSQFLAEITEEADSTDYGAMVPVLVAYCSSDDQLSRSTAITWINQFITLARRKMLPFLAELLRAILPSLAAGVQSELRDLAVTTNQTLMKLIADSDGSAEMSAFEIAPTLHVLTLQLLHDAVPTRLAALRWLLMFRQRLPDKMFDSVAEFAPALLKTLSDGSDKVVALDLEVLAEMSSAHAGETGSRARDAETFFNNFMVDLLSLFSTDRELLEKRGSFIVRQLCVLLDPEMIFRTLATILRKEDDLDFASLMVQNLNLILLTSSELYGLRTALKSMQTPQSRSLFALLYMSWCHSPVATLSLCLLAQVYEHACTLILEFAEMHVTVALLVEVDKLIQLIESPIFTHLRLQLLEPQRHAHLIKALYGLLMILPQSRAYTTLKARLDCVPTIVDKLSALDERGKAKNKPGKLSPEVDFKVLLERFREAYRMHTDLKLHVAN
eukprot:UC1_evm2s1146